MPKIVHYFIGFLVGAILMFLPEINIFVISFLLNLLSSSMDVFSGGYLFNKLVHDLLNTAGLVLVVYYGYKIVRLLRAEEN